MANIMDLDVTKLSEMSEDEAIELLRQIRLSRRTVTRPKRSTNKKPATTKVNMSADQAAELLKLLNQ